VEKKKGRIETKRGACLLRVGISGGKKRANVCAVHRRDFPSVSRGCLQWSVEVRFVSVIQARPRNPRKSCQVPRAAKDLHCRLRRLQGASGAGKGVGGTALQLCPWSLSKGVPFGLFGAGASRRWEGVGQKPGFQNIDVVNRAKSTGGNPRKSPPPVDKGEPGGRKRRIVTRERNSHHARGGKVIERWGCVPDRDVAGPIRNTRQRGRTKK